MAEPKKTDTKKPVMTEDEMRAGLSSIASKTYTPAGESLRYDVPKTRLAVPSMATDPGGLMPSPVQQAVMAQGNPALTADQMRAVAAKASGIPLATPAPLATPQEQLTPAPALGQPTDAAAGETNPSLLREMAMAEYRQGAIDDNLGSAGLRANIVNQTEGINDETEAGQQLLANKALAEEEKQPLVDETVRLAQKQEEEHAAIVKHGEEMATAQMARVQAAADDASRAEVRDFWANKDTGARILGVVSQMFAGAANGLANNPGAMTPLDRIIADDLTRQQENIKQKNRNVDTARGVLRDIYASTGSLLEANTAMYTASWKRIEVVGMQIDKKFGTDNSRIEQQKLSALAKQRIATANQKTFEVLKANGMSEKQHAINSIGEDERTQAMANRGGGGENAAIYKLAGADTPVDGRTYDRFKDADQNYKTIIAQEEKIRWIMKHAGTEGYSQAQAFKDYKVARGALVASVRKQQGTGAAMSDIEFKNMDTQLPDYLSASLPGWRGAVAGEGVMQLDRLMANVSRGYFGLVDKTLANVKLNPSDPLYGRHVTNYLKERSEQQASLQQETQPQAGAQ